MKEVWGLNNALEYIEEKEVDHKRFSYKGYVLEIKRHELFGHINGYIDFENVKDFNKSKIIEAGEENFHFGITLDTGYVIGFDCNHWGDIPPYYDKNFAELHGTELLDSTATYKTMNFVEDILKKTVDVIVGDGSD